MEGWLVIVRQGAADRFRALVKAFQDDPEVTICWDRREAERRCVREPITAERRHGRERRGRLPATWHALDFVVADQAPS